MSVRQLTPHGQKPKRTKRFWIRLVIGISILLCLMASGLIWILSAGRVIAGDWSTILPIVFAVLAVVFALLMWLFPFSPVDTREPVERALSLLHTHQLSPTVSPPQQQLAEPVPSIWNVPYLRNPFFTGRDSVLKRLHDQLTMTKAAALTQPQAISGLGGVGKTQIAVEYAYRYRDAYRFVLWVQAVTYDTLISDFVSIAGLLQLPEKDEPDQKKIVEAVRRWLENHGGWLLIFDNADDVELVYDFLPKYGKGCILLTTRAQAIGSIAESIEVEKMGLVEGMQLLLRRAKRFDQALEEDINEAGNIVIALDYLPLALDQAGAYLQETQCSLSHYLKLYQTHSKELLARRGIQSLDYPQSVATTWSLSFQKVEKANPAASEILQLCAFLAPDAIPEELIAYGAPHWGPKLKRIASDQYKLDQAIEELLKFSLIKRHNEAGILSIHRLVQVVLKYMMKRETQRLWAERVVQAVNSIFPDVNVTTWKQCLRYLPQAQTCATLIEQYSLMFVEAMYLLGRTATYLQEHSFYTVAEPLLQRALEISEQALGPEHPSTANMLEALAWLYQHQGKYELAEPLYQRALRIHEKALGSDHPSTAHTLEALAYLYQQRGKYELAESLYQRALHIHEQTLGSDHPSTAHTLEALAYLYQQQGKYELAEPLYQRALHIHEQILGPEHPSTAHSLEALAYPYQQQGKYELAESLYQRALHIHEQILGPEHLSTASTLHALAYLYQQQGKYELAEPLYQRDLRIHEQVLGPEHPSTAHTLEALAWLYHQQGKYELAEPLYQRALRIHEKALGSEHPSTAHTLEVLAYLYQQQDKYELAEPLYQRALRIYEQALGPEHPSTVHMRSSYASLLRTLKREREAAALEARAKT